MNTMRDTRSSFDMARGHNQMIARRHSLIAKRTIASWLKLFATAN